MNDSILSTFFLLLLAHYLADFPLQGEFLSRAKNHTDEIPGIPWIHAMFGHSLIHGCFVWIITGVPIVGIIEFGTHFVIDREKCSGFINFTQDQCLHICMKIFHVFLLWGMGYLHF